MAVPTSNPTVLINLFVIRIIGLSVVLGARTTTMARSIGIMRFSGPVVYGTGLRFSVPSARHGHLCR